MRTLKRLLVGLALWSALILGISVSTSDGAPPAPASQAAVTSTPTTGTSSTSVTSAPGAPVASSPADDHDNLQRDAEMTQRMSAPNASGPMFTGQIRDPQLDHSQNPAFIKALEEHQADIDQMLARPTQ
ncbi:MAG: hypothetical protein ACT452_01985 [Microthrixaceae bacterium]